MTAVFQPTVPSRNPFRLDRTLQARGRSPAHWGRWGAALPAPCGNSVSRSRGEVEGGADVFFWRGAEVMAGRSAMSQLP